jgi:hypothetical protein
MGEKNSDVQLRKTQAIQKFIIVTATKEASSCRHKALQPVIIIISQLACAHADQAESALIFFIFNNSSIFNRQAERCIKMI